MQQDMLTFCHQMKSKEQISVEVEAWEGSGGNAGLSKGSASG